MSDDLTPCQRELIAIAAAVGSNCIPCCEYHIPIAKQAGLSDRQIAAAIQLAHKVRQVQARKVLDVALSLVGHQNELVKDDVSQSACYQSKPQGGEKIEPAEKKSCCS